jgi:hypothetical protein
MPDYDRVRAAHQAAAISAHEAAELLNRAAWWRTTDYADHRDRERADYLAAIGALTHAITAAADAAAQLGPVTGDSWTGA